MGLLKKRVIAFGLTLILAMSIGNMTAFAYETSQTVRVALDRVYKSASVINIGNESIAIGSEKDGQYQEMAVLHSKDGFKVVPAKSMNVMLEDSFDYQEAIKVAKEMKEYGFSAIPGFLGDGFTVFVSGTNPEHIKELSGHNAMVSNTSTASLMELRSGNQAVAMFSGSVLPQIIAKDQNGILSLGETKEESKQESKYRGRIELNRAGAGISIINIVNIEEYLYGVVSNEMPVDYEFEALKAQAIAARTYTAQRLDSRNESTHKDDNYQLCDSHCQAYRGQNNENERTTKAVQETAGKIIMYQNAPIDAVFSASSGGYTEDSENVWQKKIDYLRGKPELNEVNVIEWEKTITLADLNKLLAKKGENIGKATDMVIKKISTGGHIQELHIIGTTGKKVLARQSICTYFSETPSGSFPSKLFTINGKGGIAEAPFDTGTSTIIRDVNISTKNGSDTFVISGKGSGHGCGLSQMGAQGMALSGKNCDEIIKYYYTGVTIESK